MDLLLVIAEKSGALLARKKIGMAVEYLASSACCKSHGQIKDILTIVMVRGCWLPGTETHSY